MDLCQLIFPVSYPGMKDCKSVLLIGSPGTCKTSLLLQMASSLSHQSCKTLNSDDCTIMFICNYQLTKIPLHVHRMPQFDAISAKNISIQYLKTFGDLISHLANLFIHVGKLTGIIIDGIDNFLKTIDEKVDGNYKDCLAKLFALLVDLGGHYSDCQDGFVGGDPCPIVASFDSNDEDINEKVLISSIGNHFFEQVAKIEPCTILGTRLGFKMTDSSDHCIYYYIDEGQIYLDRISKIKLIY
ncbi:uncharacterized protein LOC128392024 [Panonychus citri]|uniref:uncharacterized protein LOC128392024 n=1 Tax=Panonychus citri TaxID=50023 RepID=UPI002307B4F3|nr:uncharacterized protein LOC128392024 [Panonychus citri]XP_053207975.1 uncharacterized protein LOC128392024 [Panonychus citri]XP_053207976.1 uncharacterized protein LOC128392024 [Panonychus citri]XP_053207977.1 uncharacterized protein LOC128392024 [Panonychus citri]